MSVATSQTERFGANPFVVEGPIVAGSGIPGPNFSLGSVSWGPSEAEWVYCKLTLASTTTMQPGQWLQWDKDYNASLLTTTAAVVGNRCGVFSGAAQPPTISGGPVGTITLAAGVYYIWVQRSGQAPALTSGTVTANIVVAETTATAGMLAVPASPTATTKQITPVSFAAANFTFTATDTSGSPTLTALSGVSTGSGPFIGATVSGTGIPASTTITGITYSPSGAIQSITMSANATSSNAGITVTATNVTEVGLQWPYIAKVN
ncbi:hypothetical protein [Rhizobium sp. NXC24]|uniref:hypothetical protein n=1 Tax=Rhizobium sp. NXC24 TaxID=2048897 RepID=UPI000CDF3049|nr:hypothetical protein [Rhizobium sp. NXC24]AVA22473.1 hypothetical protein NXC24_CH02843 [Rhizobium sp. NXC24]